MAYSKCINLSKRDHREFLASVADKKLDVSHEPAEVDPKVFDRIREMEEAAAKKHGFING